MIELTDDAFAALIADAIDRLPPDHLRAVENVAIVYADDPTPEQRQQLKLAGNETLFGLYEGVSRTRRQGTSGYLPDKITIFKNPILHSVQTEDELKEQIYHTLWHEIAHYFGLDHQRIHELET